MLNRFPIWGRFVGEGEGGGEWGFGSGRLEESFFDLLTLVIDYVISGRSLIEYEAIQPAESPKNVLEDMSLSSIV